MFLCSQMLCFVLLLFFSFITIDSFDSLSYCQSHVPTNELFNRFGGLGWYCSTENMPVYALSVLMAVLYT